MHKLIQLLAQNRGGGGPATARIEASGDEATIYVYDAIGAWYGVDAQRFAKDVAAIEASTIHLRINSPGGDVFDARAMKTALEAHKAKVVAHVDGLAASAASFLMLAADEIEIAPGAFIMIHDPWTVAIGNGADLRSSADLLDKVGGAIAADYVGKTGKSDAEVKAWMTAETWFEADEAIEHGFVDRKTEKPAATKAAFNLSAYRNTPAALSAAAPDKDVAAPFTLLAADRQRAEARLALIQRA